MNICKINTYWKDLSWLHFDDKLIVQERQQVKDQRFCVPVFVAYLKFPSSSKEYLSRHTTVFHARLYVRFIEIQSNLIKQIEGIKTPIFLETALVIEIMQEPQSNWKEKNNPSILKDDFSSRTNSCILTSIALVLLDWSNKTSWVFPALKSASHFLP